MVVKSVDDIMQLAQQGAQKFNSDSVCDSSQILSWLVDACGTRFVVASSMQDGVLIDVVTRSLTPRVRALSDIRVLFLDTGYHFPQTLVAKDVLQGIYGFTLVEVQPELTVAEQDQQYGAQLYAQDPHRCCAMRKVDPLVKELKNYDAWITGIRRCESPTRADTPIISFDHKFGVIKVNPLALWDDEVFDQYIRDHNIYVHPLVEQGFLSIGCQPCTHKATSDDPRSGRWIGFNKTECGLHQ